MKWVTWEQVGVDRMACAWLITKYLDQEAEFRFVPAGQKPLPEEAEPKLSRCASLFVRFAVLSMHVDATRRRTLQ